MPDSKSRDASKVLWIAPNLNHYKARLLSRLARSGVVDLTVLAGARMPELGYEHEDGDEQGLKVIHLDVAKPQFQASGKVYCTLIQLLRKRNFDVVLMPCEKKHLLLILFLYILKVVCRFSLLTYTHPLMRSKGLRHRQLNRLATQMLFYLFDRVVFYNEDGMTKAIQMNLLPERKAFFANNTLDTEAIARIYSYVPPPAEPSILFISRLIPSKRLDLLISYYRDLKRDIPNLKLVIVGDGPEAPQVRTAAEQDPDIEWRGAIVDENIIAPIMKSSQIVFLPGLSGLSIVHAFCYGRPFVTITNENHGPEIAYLEDGRNGLLLDGDPSRDLSRLRDFLTNGALSNAALRAFQKADELSIARWSAQVTEAIDGRRNDASHSKIKVVLIQNVIAPYRLRLYELLAANNDLDFRIILTTKDCRHRPHWNPLKEIIKVPVLVTSSMSIPWLSMKNKQHGQATYVPYNLYHELKRHAPDVIICGGFSPSAIISYIYKKLHRKRLVIWSESNRYTDESPGVARTWIRRNLSHRADAFIDCGSLSKEYLMKSFALEDKGQFFTAYNSVEYETFERSRKWACWSAECRESMILYVGRFDENKNVRGLADIYRRLVRIRGLEGTSLTMVGEGPLRKEIEEFAKTNDLPLLRLVGQVPYDQVHSAYHGASVVVVPSFTDCIPMVILEAIGASLPIVCSNRAGSGRDFIRDGVNGYLCDPRDREAMLAKIIEVLSWDSERRKTCADYCEEMRKRATFESAEKQFVQAIQYCARPTQ